MRGAIPPLPHYAFMAWSSVKEKQRDNFIFTFNRECVSTTFITVTEFEFSYA